ncbi:MAG: hypothetical protein L6Q69_23325 [Zoogloea sp.]|nr:hypothetical protein [Zoogloea sp.]
MSVSATPNYPVTLHVGPHGFHSFSGGSSIRRMQVATGTVVDGKVVVEGVPLREGSVVAVVARGADEPFRLTDAEEAELLEAMAEIERGEFVTLDQLLDSLRKYG